jgi:NAD(P)-dependent dehydrogenase (short-subunit alcohol dehydrogenase family)
MSSPASTTEYIAQLFSLTGRTAVVIGGTGKLGGAIADALAGAGAHVVIVGRDAPAGAEAVERIQSAGWTAEHLALDATQRAELVGLRDRVEAGGHRCDILVNAAGVNSATPFLEISDEEWLRIFDVNLRSVQIACQVFGSRMIETGVKGSIINIASLSAIIPLSRVFTYSASKAAVLNLTLNLAREWAPHGIRVNAMSPGFFPAEQNRKVLTADRTAKILGHTPAGRFGEPQELAGATLLLASNVAGSFITGTNLVVDGGFMAQTI